MAGRSPKFQTKTVTFNGEELTLYSLDGATWSSRKAELSEIQTRHEDSRVTFEEIRSGIIQKKGAAKAEAAADKKTKKEEELPKPKKRTSSKKATSSKKTKSSKAA